METCFTDLFNYFEVQWNCIALRGRLRIWTSPFIPFWGSTAYQKDDGQAEEQLGLAWTWAPPHPRTCNSPLPKPHQTNIQSKSKPYACYAKAAWRCLRTRLWSQGPPKQKSWRCLCKSGAVFIVHICPSEEPSTQKRWPGQESTLWLSLARTHSEGRGQQAIINKTEFHRATGPTRGTEDCFLLGHNLSVYQVVWPSRCATAPFLELAEAPQAKGTDPIHMSGGPQIACIFDKVATSFRESLDLLSFESSLE